MKTIIRNILFIGLMFSIPQVMAEYVQDEFHISEHMREMYNLRDQIYSSLEDKDKDKIETANIILKLRQHLHSSLPKEPTMLHGVSEYEKRLMQLDYQKHVTKVIWITIELEEAILTKTTNEMEKLKRDDKINDLMISMLKTVSQGHAKYRKK